jgi:hypothetical protein
MALNMCRGHFKTYVSEGPLFGKYTGTYWRDQFMRGDSRSGVVLKDYKIKL